MVKVANVNMPEWLASFFVFAGFILVGINVIIILLLTWDVASKWYKHRRYIYKQKHRFDKPPLAKCYCKDCEYNGGYKFKNICYVYPELHVDDDWFCWKATPRTEDSDAEVME